MLLRSRPTERNSAAVCAILPGSSGSCEAVQANGALCPVVRLVPGARGDIHGDRLAPDPVWQSASIPRLPRPLCSPHRASVEVIMAPRKQQTTPALPPQLAAVNLPAAGLDIGAEAHFVAVPPSDDPQPVRSFGAYTAALAALADWLATCGLTTGPSNRRASSGARFLSCWRRVAAKCSSWIRNRSRSSGADRRVPSTIARGSSASPPAASWPARFGLPTRSASCTVLCGNGLDC
jgi:hypothetical protein